MNNETRHSSNQSLMEISIDLEQMAGPLNGLAYLFLALASCDPSSPGEELSDFYNLAGNELKRLSRICRHASDTLTGIIEETSKLHLQE